jgi:hypothetical protein
MRIKLEGGRVSREKPLRKNLIEIATRTKPTMAGNQVVQSQNIKFDPHNQRTTLLLCNEPVPHAISGQQKIREMAQ